jgi:hypothetical protein
MNCLPCIKCKNQPEDCHCDYYDNGYVEKYENRLDRWKYLHIPHICLALMPILASLFLFGGTVTDSHKILFSNDGPLGVMASGYMVDAAPGVGFWNDLDWLGSSGGVFPASPSFVIIWLLQGYNWMLVPSLLFFGWSLKRLIKAL